MEEVERTSEVREKEVEREKEVVELEKKLEMALERKLEERLEAAAQRQLEEAAQKRREGAERWAEEAAAQRRRLRRRPEAREEERREEERWRRSVAAEQRPQYVVDERPSKLSYDEEECPVEVLHAVRWNQQCKDPVKPVVVTDRVRRALRWAWQRGGCRDLRRMPCGSVFRCGSEEQKGDLRGFWQMCSESMIGPDVCPHAESWDSEELELHWRVKGGPEQRRRFRWGRALDLTPEEGS